jgi:hypothetical protein
LREARRQKQLPDLAVPGVCLLDPDGDIVRHLATTGTGSRHPGWACYHTDMWVTAALALTVAITRSLPDRDWRRPDQTAMTSIRGGWPGTFTVAALALPWAGFCHWWTRRWLTGLNALSALELPAEQDQSNNGRCDDERLDDHYPNGCVQEECRGGERCRDDPRHDD